MKVRQIGVVAVLGVSLFGCATVQLTRPSGELIQLGKTTQRHVTDVMGTPAETSTKHHHGTPVVNFTYFDGKRFAYFHFVEGVLVGYRFDGRCPAECLDFRDAEKITGIIAHRSTRNDVEALLGTPSGEEVYPLTDMPDARQLTYVYLGGPSLYTEVYVTIDRADTVTDIRRVNLKEK